jgi:hypothetical protein
LPRTTATRAVRDAGLAFSMEATAPALHPIACPVEIRGDGHVAPPLHGQEDDLGAVDQPLLSRAGAAQLLKGGALLGGERDDNRGGGPLRRVPIAASMDVATSAATYAAMNLKPRIRAHGRSSCFCLGTWATVH